MFFAFLIALATGMLTYALYRFIFRFNRERKLVLVGRRGCGKTAFFVNISLKELSTSKTVPSLEPHSERIGGWIIVDTPGVTDEKSLKRVLSATSSLTPLDRVAIFFRSMDEMVDVGGNAKKVYVYSGDAPIPSEIKKLCPLVELGPEGKMDRDEVKKIFV
jgi:hypothetical protein